jgi:hypothetical protein
LGGFGGGGEFSSARKAYARQLDDFKVYSVQKPPKSRKYDPMIVGFLDEDYVGVSLPHIDALVVSLTIANHRLGGSLLTQEAQLISCLSQPLTIWAFHGRGWS